MTEPTTEYIRLTDIYDSMSFDSVLESLTDVKMLTSTDRIIAFRQAGEILHAQGSAKNRKIMNDYSLGVDEDTLKADYVDDLLKVSQIGILNRYIAFLEESKDVYKMKTLLVYIMFKDLYMYTSELNFSNQYADYINIITTRFNDEKNKILQELIDYFTERKLELHAKVTFEAGFRIFEVKPLRVIPLFFGKLIQEGEPTPNIKETRGHIIFLRQKFLKVSKSIEIKNLCAIVGFDPRTYRERKVRIEGDLREFATEDEVTAVNELIKHY